MVTIRRLSSASVISLQQAGNFIIITQNCLQNLQPTQVIQVPLPLQDARKSIQALRFSSSEVEKLGRDHGYVGCYNMAESGDLTAVGVKNATCQMIKDLCTPQHSAPCSVTRFNHVWFQGLTSAAVDVIVV